MKSFKRLREAVENAAPKENWTASANIPFYGTLDKPRPSISKHEGTRRARHLWHMDDIIFVLVARQDVPKLLEAFDLALDFVKKSAQPEAGLIEEKIERLSKRE